MIVQGQTYSFRQELYLGIHDLDTDVLKIALYNANADVNLDTTVYASTNEVTGTGYTAGGNTLTVSQVPTSTGTTAFLDFSDTTWSNATITANGALIYNSTQSDKAVAVLAF